MKVELGQFPQAKVLRRNDWGWAISNGNVVCCSWAQSSEDIVLVLSQCVQRSVILLAIFFLDQVGKLFFPTNNFRSKQSKSLKTVQITKSSKKVCKKPDIFHFFPPFFSRPQVSIRFFGSGRFGATWCSGSSSTAFLFRTLVVVERFPDKIWIGDFPRVFVCVFFFG